MTNSEQNFTFYLIMVQLNLSVDKIDSIVEINTNLFSSKPNLLSSYSIAFDVIELLFSEMFSLRRIVCFAQLFEQ